MRRRAFEFIRCSLMVGGTGFGRNDEAKAEPLLAQTPPITLQIACQIAKAHESGNSRTNREGTAGRWSESLHLGPGGWSESLHLGPAGGANRSTWNRRRKPRFTPSTHLFGGECGSLPRRLPEAEAALEGVGIIPGTTVLGHRLHMDQVTAADDDFIREQGRVQHAADLGDVTAPALLAQ